MLEKGNGRSKYKRTQSGLSLQINPFFSLPFFRISSFYIISQYISHSSILLSEYFEVSLASSSQTCHSFTLSLFLQFFFPFFRQQSQSLPLQSRLLIFESNGEYRKAIKEVALSSFAARYSNQGTRGPHSLDTLDCEMIRLRLGYRSTGATKSSNKSK